MNLEELERDYASRFTDGVMDLGLDKKKLLALLIALLAQSGDSDEAKRTIESWSPLATEKWLNGENYIESLNQADTRFLANMSKEIDELIALGVTVYEAAEYLGQRYYSTRVHDLSRILVTEGTRIASAEALERSDSYIYHCVGDSRTCPECLALDGTVMSAKDAQYGSNVPPMHPWCRCWIEPWTN